MVRRSLCQRAYLVDDTVGPTVNRHAIVERSSRLSKLIGMLLYESAANQSTEGVDGIETTYFAITLPDSNEAAEADAVYDAGGNVGHGEELGSIGQVGKSVLILQD